MSDQDRKWSREDIDEIIDSRVEDAIHREIIQGLECELDSETCHSHFRGGEVTKLSLTVSFNGTKISKHEITI